MKHQGDKPAHYYMRLPAGEEAELLAEDMAEWMEREGLCAFGARDKYLYYELDGTMAQLKQIIPKIETCAVYARRYRGLVAMNISALIGYACDEQTQFLARALRQLGKEAGLLLLLDKEAPELLQALQREVTDLQCFEEREAMHERR